MSGRGRGRGWYYKEKYGSGRGRGRGRSDDGPPSGSWQPRDDTGSQHHQQQPDSNAAADDDDGYADYSAGAGARARVVGTATGLGQVLRRIDGRGYKAYEDIRGGWACEGYVLWVDRVQGDPYAAPSNCRVELPPEAAGVPADLLSSRIRSTALCDYLTRSFGAAVSAAGADVRRQAGGWSGEKGGELCVDRPGQHVLERSSVCVLPGGGLEARFTVALPARGRSVLGRWAAAVLLDNLPGYVRRGLHYAQQDAAALRAHVACVEDTQALRDALPALGLVAFLGDGAVLPRRSGASDEPMPAAEAAALEAPASLAVQVDLPNAGRIRGLGIRAGITLIVGGGFHGKSTLLRALEAGVYNKVPGDGRERVAALPCAVKARAEDGRRVASVDVSPFISNLPLGRPTHCFSTDDASGSTSQAANIQEAIEAGCRLLLIDEDTSATNFMIRDARMQALVSADREPITPFIARIRALAQQRGVSCVLVVGGSGEYFDVADAVLCMDSYRPRDVTAEARAVAARFASAAGAVAQLPEYGSLAPRALRALHLAPPHSGPHGRDIRIRARGVRLIQVDDTDLDLSAVEQLVEASQARAIAAALAVLRGRSGALAQLLDWVEAEMDAKGVGALGGGLKPGDLARPRRHELAAAINRLRCARIEQL